MKLRGLGIYMTDYSSSLAIFLSIITGIILYFFFDGVFILTLTGFLATYLTNHEERTVAVGIIASLLLGVLYFSYGLILTPEIPLQVLNTITFDFNSFLMGFVLIALISILLGALGGYVATKIIGYKQSSY